ncbi:signal peptidase II [Roseospira marina]|uniref:Lipoprotein signal peptidase n=1 Tax=Roseospira marina TaxID=140057 RepID=A0A5M6IA20_9PROT|nr:signal peptidase II [Roseospira marina]KAA5604579.1 signal peptidase II [Roseospira marina]MBB4315329.1 signal peptidase II [Roseospira marina]MBB5088328.1 signal peptidase II [Roseospira marina]
MGQGTEHGTGGGVQHRDRAPARPVRWGLTLAAVVILLDQATKYAVFAGLQPAPTGVPVTGFFSLVRVWNPGVSFGLFATGSPWTPIVLTGLALAVSVGLAWWLRRAGSRVAVGGLGLLIGGAVGNAIDRMVHGAVMDFLDVHVAGYHWPAFNVADSAITVGAVLLVWDALFAGGKSPKTNGG